jgi:hypothetical protein
MSDKVPVGVDPRVEPEDDVLEPEDDVLEPEDDVLEPEDAVRRKVVAFAGLILMLMGSDPGMTDGWPVRHSVSRLAFPPVAA